MTKAFFIFVYFVVTALMLELALIYLPQLTSPPPMDQRTFLGLFLLAIGAALYFLPTVFALSRDHGNSQAVFALNLLLGWTFLGWAVAIVWSLTVPRQRTGHEDK